MDLPIELKNYIDSLAEGIKLSELNKVSTSLSQKYLLESGNNNRLVVSYMDALVYSIVRMPATYSSIYEVSKNTFKYYSKDEIHSVLDVGAGTGAASWALSFFLNDDTKYYFVEREKEMINLGKKFCELNPQLRNGSWYNIDFLKEDISIKADLVIVSYALNELDEISRNKIIEKLYELTNKVLIVVEPGTQIAFNEIKALRNKLIFEGGNVIAPCPHSEKCPNDWCHFASRINRSKLHKLIKEGQAPFEDEKYSYFAISKELTSSCQNRVLRHPIISNGFISVNVCNSDGVNIIKVTKKDKELYKIVKKCSWGDDF